MAEAAAAAAAKPAKQSYSTDPALYMYTSLTAGSSHIVTATSRLETILKANRVPFKAIDIATDEKARMLWGRRAGKDANGRLRKLPGLVQMGLILGDLAEIEEWNEYGELKQHVTIYYDEHTIPPKGAAQPKNPLKPVYNKKPAAPSGSSYSTTTPRPAPAAPPLPEKKEGDASKTGGENKKSTVAAAAAAVTQPVKSIAEEAAEKAKKVRLEALRAKVHGNKDKDSEAEGKNKENIAATDGGEKKADAGATPAPLTLKKDVSVDSVVSTTSTTTSSLSPAGQKKVAGTAGLQSPTSGAWKTTSHEDHLRNVLQSPTSSTWKPGDSDLALPIREHRGSTVAKASAEEIVAVEQAEAIPEDPREEEEEEDEDEDEEEQDKKKEEQVR